MMKKTNRYIIGILLLLISTIVNAQNQQGNYVIITLERERTWDMHRVEYSYWLMPSDSLSQSRYKFINLYMNGFSKNSFESCCTKDSLAMYNTTDTNFDLDKDYVNELEMLIGIVKSKRQKIQSIKKDWGKKGSETINVYATPVIGTFCRCRLGKSVNNVEGVTHVMLPKSGFKLNDNFWSNKGVVALRGYDFSSLPFLDLNSIL